MLIELNSKYFDSMFTFEDLFVDRTLCFGDYMKMGTPRDERKYEEVSDKNKMISVIEDYLADYNLSSKNTMDLVFFMDAVEHLNRIARILRQPRGNAMLVGTLINSIDRNKSISIILCE